MKMAAKFPGQGVQYPQMGSYFYNNYGVAEKVFREVSNIVGYNVGELCMKGSISEINRFANLQILIFTVGVAMYQCFLYDYEVKPDILMGHSIGEYVALVCSGAASLEDTLYILKKRNEVVERVLTCRTERMAIVENCSESRIAEALKSPKYESNIYISSYNSHTQFSVVGDVTLLNDLSRLLSKEGARVTHLPLSPPMHSGFMSTVKHDFMEFLEKVFICPLSIPIMSNVLGRKLEDSKDLKRLMAEHLVEPVQWRNCVEHLKEEHISLCIEISPRSLVSFFTKEVYPEGRSLCYGLNKDRAVLDSCLN